MERTAPKSLSVFFPMYNEVQHMDEVLAQAIAVVPTLGFEHYEILIVDDGSKDGCDQVVRRWMENYPSIRMVQHPKNQGYGAALRTGFLEARGDAVFYTDSDLPVDLRMIATALGSLGQADLVIGYRKHRHETLRRAVYSRVYNLLMRLMFGVYVRDVNFSFKMVRRAVLDRARLTATSVFIDGQILAEAVRHGFEIHEIPIDYTPRKFGVSNFDSLAAAQSTWREMAQYWLERRSQP